jgi:4-hydroxy-2-oxoglutarate aldolase
VTNRPRDNCILTSLLPLDVPTFTGHVVRLAQANVWPVICGSMGEAHHLTNEERVTLIKAAREALDQAGLNDTPIMAGT